MKHRAEGDNAEFTSEFAPSEGEFLDTPGLLIYSFGDYLPV